MKAAYQATQTEDNSDAATARIVAAQLNGLAALREVGVGLAGQLGAYARGELPEKLEKPFEGEGAIRALARVARAVRQLISMEQEILGLRPMPEGSDSYHAGRMAKVYRTIRWGSDEYDPDDLRDPDDLNEPSDLDDYDRGPADQVIAGIRKALGVGEASSLLAPSSRGTKRRGDPSEVLKAKDVDARPARNAPIGVTQEAASGGEYGHDETGRNAPRTISTRNRDPP